MRDTGPETAVQLVPADTAGPPDKAGPPKHDRVYERLKRWICSEEPPVDEQLVIRALAQRLGVSATPVLQALHRLADEGLVVRSRSRGFFPSLPSAEEARDAYAAAYLYVAEGLLANRGPRLAIPQSETAARLRDIAQGSDTEMLLAFEAVLREAAMRDADPERPLQIERNIDLLARLRRSEVRTFPNLRRELLRMVRAYQDSKYEPFLRQFAQHTQERADGAEAIVRTAGRNDLPDDAGVAVNDATGTGTDAKLLVEQPA